MSIFLANPELVQKLTLRCSQAPVLGKYSLVFIAAFLAFVIGHALLLWVGLIHRILRVVYRVVYRGVVFIWRHFVGHFTNSLNRRINQQTWLGRKSFTRWLHRTVVRIYAQHDGFGFRLSSRGARQLWAILILRIFKKRFDIDLNLDQEEWDALYQASRNDQLTQLSNHLLMLAGHALGWAGIAAIRFAPSLANKNYIALSTFMIVIGMMYEWWFIRLMNDPYAIGLLKLRALIRDLRRVPAPNSGEAEQKQGRGQ